MSLHWASPSGFALSNFIYPYFCTEPTIHLLSLSINNFIYPHSLFLQWASAFVNSLFPPGSPIKLWRGTLPYPLYARSLYICIEPFWPYMQRHSTSNFESSDSFYVYTNLHHPALHHVSPSIFTLTLNIRLCVKLFCSSMHWLSVSHFASSLPVYLYANTHNPALQ